VMPNVPCMMAEHSTECWLVFLLQDVHEHTIPNAKQGLQLQAGKTSWISLGANACAEGWSDASACPNVHVRLDVTNACKLAVWSSV